METMRSLFEQFKSHFETYGIAWGSSVGQVDVNDQPRLGQYLDFSVNKIPFCIVFDEKGGSIYGVHLYTGNECTCILRFSEKETFKVSFQPRIIKIFTHSCSLVIQW
ncbi:MAG: hypothetical protein G01um101470_402 [Parcubacteria group bacterium Gr01-1014_70]|nr:MAG: hypothetical protein G01um101470_402 [Parcubacteria group bacterium Gr01-1014_70]